ncbi:MAG: T9SS type A sorting domain-containing protein [Bacteroidota bacterium]
MKKIILLISVFSICISAALMAQVIPQTVTINPGYHDQVYYSMQNGASPAVDNTNWDLGFQLRGFGASIIVNEKNNVKVYRANKSISSWASITVADTTGILNDTYRLHNSDISWDLGALSGTYDTTNAFDLGWGVYDFVTHAVTGDSLFFIQLSTGDFKKLWIESLTTGVFYFRWADLDGANEVAATLDKANFTSRYFGFYSIVNNTWIDREPVTYNQWDLLFTQYLSVTPFVYMVAGVLSNDSVFTAKAYPVDVATTGPSGQYYSLDINTIGYLWKTYDFANNIWTIEDSLVYFVKDRSAGMWKVIFTGFGGSATGTYDFTKEFLGVVGVDENSVNPVLSLYPNPVSESLNMIIANTSSRTDAVVHIINMLGAEEKKYLVELNAPLNTVSLNVSDLHPGIYLLNVEQNGRTSTQRFVVQ